jgi:altronate hydrolase
MKNNALKINENDNVAVAATQLSKGDPIIINGEQLFNVVEDIKPGHKIALVPIASGERVFRYGEPIVEAIRNIGQGEWVHVHNTRPISRESSDF